MMDVDFVGCQTVGVSQDEILNKNGIDKIMFELYANEDPSDPSTKGYGRLGKDMHSTTCYNSFIATSNEQILEMNVGKKEPLLFHKDQDVYLEGLDLAKAGIIKVGDRIRGYSKDKDVVEVLSISSRPCTVEDVIAMKGYEPYKTNRTVAKHVGLSVIFYSQVPTLAAVLKEVGWSNTKWKKVLDNLGLQKELSEMGTKSRNKTTEELILLTIAERLHKDFFTTYPGLKERCLREQDFAKRKYYVRSWHGPVRQLPELKYMLRQGQDGLKDADMFLHSKEFAGLKNQASNTTIQTLEQYECAQVVHNLQTNFKANNMKSRVWNYIHDSWQIWSHKSERDDVIIMNKKTLDVPRWPRYGIPLDGEGEIADLTQPGQYFKNGKPVELKDGELSNGRTFVNYVRK